MSDVTLTSAVRSNLLALQSTQGLVNRTQGRLSTGLKVASAIDDPVAYFQSKALNDRASDFQSKKDNIDQGVSSLSTALQGITGVQTLVKQLKGLALNAQSSSSAQIGSLVAQFNGLRSQLDNLAIDSQYQGQNLIAGVGQTLNVSFSNLTASNLAVSSVDVRVGASGLNIAKAVTSNGSFQLSYDDASGGTLGTSIIRAVYAGSATNLTSGAYTFSYGSGTVTINVYSAGSTSAADIEGFTTTSTLTNGQTTLAFRVSTLSNVGNFAITTGDGSQNSTKFAVEYGASTNGGISSLSLTDGDSITGGLAFNGLTGSSFASGTYTFSYGGTTLTFTVGSQGAASTTFTTTSNFSNGDFGSISAGIGVQVTLSSSAITQAGFFKTSASVSAAFTGGSVLGQAYGTGSDTIYAAKVSANSTLGYVSGQYVLDANLSGVVQSLITKLDNNLQTLRSVAQNLGTNVALLNTRLDFTKSYVDLLQSGAGKLTLADLNEEGANLLALQTRQDRKSVV